MLDLYDSQPRTKRSRARVWIDAIAALSVLGFLMAAMLFPEHDLDEYGD